MNGEKKNILEDIEMLRGFACILVLIQHIAWICPLRYTYNIVPYRLLFGEGGVFIFFAISGFVVTLSLRDKLSSGGIFLERLDSAKSLLFSFYKKRFFRIFPMMMVAILLTGGFLFASETGFHWFVSWLRSIADLFFGVFNYSEEVYQATDRLFDGGMGPLWTIAVESQFYLLWPIMLLLCKDNNARAIMSFLLGCLFLFVVQPLTAGFVGIKYYATYGHLPCLFLGAFLAFIYTEDIGEKVSKNWAKIITIIFAMVIWYYPNSIERTYFCRMPLHIASILLVMFCAFVKDSFNFPLIGRFFRYLGSRSYSFYVIQLPLASWTVFFTNSIYFPKESLSEYEFYVYQFIMFFVVLFVMTELSYRFIEKPLRQLGRKE